MNCPKCTRQIPDDAILCCYCGKKLVKTERTGKQRGNGTGTAFKRGKTWTARVTIGWEYKDGKKIQK